jgi:3'-5' exoribonuclease
MSLRLKDCTVGQQISGYLAVKECTVRSTKNNPDKLFLDMQLTDGQITVGAKVWNHSGDSPENNTVIFIEANVTEFRGEKQLTVNTWRVAESSEYNPRDFLPVSPRDTKEMWQEIQSYAAQVKDPGLKNLLKSIFDEHANSFTMAPAAVFHHHASISGLMEHVLGTIAHLPTDKSGLDTSILISSCLLHDIGKIEEIDHYGCTFQTTDRGKLLGHITLGMMIINEHAKNCPGLSKEKLDHLLHIVASHHGRLDWGSPVEPLTAEALVVHNADMLDMQMWKVKNAALSPQKGNWTEKIAGINRSFCVFNSK